MLKVSCIGHIGGDAEIKEQDGRKFVTFRVAHSDRWKDDAGNTHESTQWVDCIMDGEPSVTPYLKRGTSVYVSGNVKLRVYSSAKDRCMKAGLTISVRSIELIGARPDAVPGSLVDGSGIVHPVVKFYQIPGLIRNKKEVEHIPVTSLRGDSHFLVDRNGWVIADNANKGDSNDTDQVF